MGYLQIAFFPGVNGQRFARELDRALITLHDSSRLIVDLRGNLGGFVGSLRLMSHLTADRVPIGYSLTRKGENRRWRPDQLACIHRLPATRLDTFKMGSVPGPSPRPVHPGTLAQQRLRRTAHPTRVWVYASKHHIDYVLRNERQRVCALAIDRSLPSEPNREPTQGAQQVSRPLIKRVRVASQQALGAFLLPPL